jgi:hypothetical protein
MCSLLSFALQQLLSISIAAVSGPYGPPDCDVVQLGRRHGTDRSVLPRFECLRQALAKMRGPWCRWGRRRSACREVVADATNIEVGNDDCPTYYVKID